MFFDIQIFQMNLSKSEISRELSSKGFVIIPRVFSHSVVENLRRVCEDYRKSLAQDDLLASDFLTVIELAESILNPDIIFAMQSALGPTVVLLPEFGVQVGKYGDWHRDIEPQWTDPDLVKNGLVYGRKLKVFTFAIYLQTNDEHWGGGLSVKPYSHILPSPRSLTGKFLRRAKNYIDLNLIEEFKVPSKAGDLVIFDHRLCHKATHPTAALPASMNKKIGMFWAATNDPSYAELWYKYAAETRKESPFYRNVAKLRFPNSYPANMISKMAGANISVASNRLVDHSKNEG